MVFGTAPECCGITANNSGEVARLLRWVSFHFADATVIQGT
jgi:hypothetical protein